jgi:hypothetical protein
MADELDNPDIEVKGRMAEDIMAEEAGKLLGDPGPKLAPLKEDHPPAAPQPPATPSAAQPAPAAATPPAQPVTPAAQPAPAPQPSPEPVSFLSGLEDGDEDEEAGGEPPAATFSHKAPGATPGMIRDIQTERQRRKAAEAQAAELKRQLDEAQARQQTAAQQVDLDLNSLLGEGAEDDLVEKGKLVQALPKVIDAAVQRATAAILQEAQQREAAAQAKAAKQQREQAMDASEAAIRKTVPDYDAVVKQAMDLNVLTVEEKRAILTSPNPAGTLYFKAKQVLGAFGIQPQPPVAAPQPPANPAAPAVPENQQTPPEPSDDQIQSDEELYAAIYAKP